MRTEHTQEPGIRYFRRVKRRGPINLLGRAVRVRCRSLSVLVVALLLSLSCGPNPDPVRPRGVPVDAVLIMSTKIGWWQHCAIMAEGQGVQCRIWNGLGLILAEKCPALESSYEPVCRWCHHETRLASFGVGRNGNRASGHRVACIPNGPG